jgi:hypothetical protein
MIYGNYIKLSVIYNYFVSGSVVDWGIRCKMEGRGSSPDEVIEFFNWPNPSSRGMALGSSQPLAGLSIRNLPGSNGWPERKADNLTAICEPIVYKMWEPRCLTNVMGLHGLLQG